MKGGMFDTIIVEVLTLKGAIQMETSYIQIQVSSEMKQLFAVEDKEMELVQKALMLYPMIKNQTISHGRAAAMLGMNKLDLIYLYSSYGIPYIDMEAEELQEDVDSLMTLFGEKL